MDKHQIEALSCRVEEILSLRPWLSLQARRTTKDAWLAQDLEQETLLTALNETPALEGLKLQAWLAVVMRNRYRDMLRSGKRRTRRESVAARPEVWPEESYPEEFRAACETAASGIAELPAELRQVVLARFFHGESLPRLAARTGVPRSTLQTRLGKALQLLRGDIEREHGLDWSMCLLPFWVWRFRIERSSKAARYLAASGTLAVGLTAVGSWRLTHAKPIEPRTLPGAPLAIGDLRLAETRPAIASKRTELVPATVLHFEEARPGVLAATSPFANRASALDPLPATPVRAVDLTVALAAHPSGPAQQIEARCLDSAGTIHGLQRGAGAVLFAGLPPGRTQIAVSRAGGRVQRLTLELPERSREDHLQEGVLSYRAEFEEQPDRLVEVVPQPDRYFDGQEAALLRRCSLSILFSCEQEPDLSPVTLHSSPNADQIRFRSGERCPNRLQLGRSNRALYRVKQSSARFVHLVADNRILSTAELEPRAGQVTLPVPIDALLAGSGSIEVRFGVGAFDSLEEPVFHLRRLRWERGPDSVFEAATVRIGVDQWRLEAVPHGDFLLEIDTGSGHYATPIRIATDGALERVTLQTAGTAPWIQIERDGNPAPGIELILSIQRDPNEEPLHFSFLADETGRLQLPWIELPNEAMTMGLCARNQVNNELSEQVMLPAAVGDGGLRLALVQVPARQFMLPAALDTHDHYWVERIDHPGPPELLPRQFEDPSACLFPGRYRLLVPRSAGSLEASLEFEVEPDSGLIDLREPAAR